ncbi:MAG: tyrosine-type recombinase/integrase [Actinocatenispora sp.]
MVVGVYAASGRSRQRSFTVHGDEAFVARRQRELVATYGVRRVVPPGGGERLTVAAVLDRYVSCPHRWSPHTLRSHESVARALMADRLGRRMVGDLTVTVMEAAFARWAAAGESVSVISGRFRVLHAAISWAMCERLLLADPLVGMRAPQRPYPRKHLRAETGRQLIATAERIRDKARSRLAERPDAKGRQLALFRAEQDVLLVRLAADSGARRGELAALRVDDLDGRVLSIERAARPEIGPTKTLQNRRLTLGVTVTRCWVEHVAAWRGHPLAGPRPGPWLFAATPARERPVQPGGLSQRFVTLRAAAGAPEATLHRFRHTTATHLVSHGKILKATNRLGHRDPSTTLRTYADALPLDDQDAADELDALYNPAGHGTTSDNRA